MDGHNYDSVSGILEPVARNQHGPDRGNHYTFALVQAHVSTILRQPRRSNVYLCGLPNRGERIALHSRRNVNRRSMRTKQPHAKRAIADVGTTSGLYAMSFYAEI